MLALAMALLAGPRLLLIDELSLGLAPIVVERLLESVRDLRAAGTAVLLVEQSVNVAVAVADRVVRDGPRRDPVLGPGGRDPRPSPSCCGRSRRSGRRRP